MTPDRINTTRRDALRRMGVGLAAVAAASCSRPEQPKAKRPNILMVLTDDQTANEMSCYGNPVLKTPNMDRIANEGSRFDRAFCTNSLCAPGRASILSGAYSHINGILGNSEGADQVEKFRDGVAVFPELLRNAGYTTAVVGKWHLQQDPWGFDYWCVLPGQGVYNDPDFIEMGKKKKIPGYATDITTDLALKWLDQTKSQEKPFCLLFWHKAPHRPFTPAPRHKDLYADVDLPKPPTYNDDYRTRKVAAQAEDMQFVVSLENDYPEMPKRLNPRQKKDWIYDRMVKDHYRCVVGVDEGLGKVLDWLDNNGQAEDTLILYTSDNGYFLGEYGWYDKRFMYEPSQRIPFVARYPRTGSKGLAMKEMVLNIDIAPTILDYAGVQAPQTMQGRSLRPLLEGAKPDDWRKSVYYTYYENSWRLTGADKSKMTDPSFRYFTPHRIGPHRGVRTDRYKLIHYYAEGDYWELFDLEKDPNEINNVYGNAVYAEIRDDLKAELNRLREQYRDT